MHRAKNILWNLRKGYYATLIWVLIHLGIKQAKVSCIIQSIIFELKLLAIVFISIFTVYTLVVTTAEPTLTTLEIILKINGIFFLVIIFLILKIIYRIRNNTGCSLHPPHGPTDEHK